MPIYVKYGDIKGDVTADGHKGSDCWFEVNSLQWGATRRVGSATGKAANREGSAPTVSEVRITKAMDIASYALIQEALQGRGEQCEIHFCKTDKGSLETYCKLILDDCLISGYSMNSGGDRPQEALSISFTRIEYGFVGMDDKNTPAETPKVIYDVALGKIV